MVRPAIVGLVIGDEVEAAARMASTQPAGSSLTWAVSTSRMLWVKVAGDDVVLVADG